MKALTIFALFICQQVCAQTAVSIGTSRWSETSIDLHDHFLKPFDKSLRYSHLKVNVGGSYQLKHHLFSAELNRFKKRDVLYFTSISSVSGGGSSPTYYYSKQFRSRVSYAYVGFKLGYAYSFEGTSPFCDKWKTMVEIGVFVGGDFLTSYSESGHYTKETASNNSNMSQEFVTTLNEESHEEFKGVSMRKAPAFAGLFVARRLTFGNIFIRGAVSYGTLNYGSRKYVRVIPLNSSRSEGGSKIIPEPERKRFFSVDFSIGFMLNNLTFKPIPNTSHG